MTNGVEKIEVEFSTALDCSVAYHLMVAPLSDCTSSVTLPEPHTEPVEITLIDGD